MTKTCFYCGRKGSRGFYRRMDGWRCANGDACLRRTLSTTPAEKFRQIRALIDREEFSTGDAAYLARQIRKVLDR